MNDNFMISVQEFEKRLVTRRNEVNERLKIVLAKQDPTLLYEPMRYTLFGAGKRFRPILVLMTCEAVGGDYKNALDASVAVELLHNFTLIHDDVMDQDDTRRNRPTVHKKWDLDIAILSGDGLVALSYEYLLKTRYEHIDCLGILFSKALLQVCEGQALDKQFESCDDVSPSDYFEMIEKKTAALLALCCELGSYIGGANQEVVYSLRQFGLNMGLAFQIQDDLLDIMAEENHLGKTWGSDIKRKKQTLLLIQARKNATPDTLKEINDIMNKVEISDDDLHRMTKIFQETGTLDFSKTLLNRYFQKARENIQVLDPIFGRSLLERFLEIVVQRSN